MIIYVLQAIKPA